MKFLTASESGDWCRARAIALLADGKPSIEPPGMHVARFEIPRESSRVVWFSRAVEAACRPWSQILLWVTEWGVWASSENWQLYYRIRQSYGEERLLGDAPSQLFGAEEVDDLLGFLQIGLIAGWDMNLISAEPRRQVFLSHDGWIRLATAASPDLIEAKAVFEEGSVRYLGA